MNIESDQPLRYEAPTRDEPTVFDLLVVLARYKRVLFLMPLLFGIVAGAVSLTLPNLYTATARILPPQQGSSAAASMLSQLGGLLGGLAGSSSPLGGKTPSDVYVGMLKSRTMADRLIERLDLKAHYQQQKPSALRGTLDARSRIVSGKEGIITLDVDDPDPKVAAAIANGYVEELTKMTQVLAVTEASQRRLFFEQQLAQARRNLAAAQVDAKQALENGGIAMVDIQGRAMVEVTSRLRAQISVKEVQMAAMRVYAADNNPQLRAAQQELDALRAELARLEGVSVSQTKSAASAASKGESGLKNLDRLRDVKYYETIFELLSRQFELAKIDEAKDPGIIQVLDVAVEPDTKSKPARTIIVLLSALAGLTLAIFYAFVRQAVLNARADPVRAASLADLRENLTWR